MSSTSLVPYQAKKKPSTQPAIDNYTEIIPPIDFSFCSLERMLDAVNEEPRLPVSPRGKGKLRQPEKDEEGSSSKYGGKSIMLNNNNITNIEGFVTFIEDKFSFKENVCWINLAQNELTTIGTELTAFVNLQILYLHGNQINNIEEVDHLTSLRKLEKLTLHGNPIENTRGYRSIVISKLPQLKSLDFSLITKGDRRTSNFIGDKSAGRKKKKVDEDDD